VKVWDPVPVPVPVPVLVLVLVLVPVLAVAPVLFPPLPLARLARLVQAVWLVQAQVQVRPNH